MPSKVITDDQRNLISDRRIFGTMLAFAFFCLLAAFILTIEKLHLLQDPQAVLSCSFNLVLNCSTVMQTWQSSVFGFPNMYIGLMAYPIVITLAVAGLSGVKFPRPFLIAGTIGIGLGLVFSYWLFFQSLYAIQVLCPWCLVVTFSTTIIFASALQYGLKENIFHLSEQRDRKVQQFLKKGYGTLVIVSWVVLLIALVFLKFGESLFA